MDVKCERCGNDIDCIGGNVYWCDECCVDIVIEDDGTQTFMDDDFDDDTVPDGCRECDNPTYPDCMDSCPLYDD